MNRMANVTLDKNNPDFHTDIPRLRKGGVGAQVRGLNLNSSQGFKLGMKTRGIESIWECMLI